MQRNADTRIRCPPAVAAATFYACKWLDWGDFVGFRNKSANMVLTDSFGGHIWRFTGRELL
jgi:hypothetical protein